MRLFHENYAKNSNHLKMCDFIAYKIAFPLTSCDLLQNLDVKCSVTLCWFFFLYKCIVLPLFRDFDASHKKWRFNYLLFYLIS